MKKSAEQNTPSAERGKLESGVFIGQIEQVVSSADCRSAKPSDTPRPQVSQQMWRRKPAGYSIPRAESAEHEGYVYFISDGRFVKVGWARDPYGRMCDLQTGSAQRLSILGVVGGQRSLESEYHRFFEDGRIHGEWFDPARSDKLAELVQRLEREADEIEAPPIGRRGHVLVFPERWAMFE